MNNKIFCDITELVKHDKNTGIQRVTSKLLIELNNNMPINYCLIPVIGNKKSGKYHLSYAYMENIGLAPEDQECDGSEIQPFEGDIFLGLDLSYNISPLLVNRLKAYKNEGVAIYTVIYDLIPLRHPHWFEGNISWFEGNEYLDLFLFWFSSVVEVSSGLICISKTVYDDISDWLDENLPNIEKPPLDYFHLGTDLLPPKSIKILQLNKNLLKSIGDDGYYLMVGTVEPRKGHMLGVKTFETLWNQGIDIKLVILGKAGWKMDEYFTYVQNHPQLNSKLILLDDVNDEELMNVYLNATALLSLSEVEGYGLPNIEAANLGVPIIARDIDVFREVCGNGAYYVKKKISPEELAEEILIWRQLRKNGTYPKPSEVNVQSWKDSANQILEVVNRLGKYGFEWRK